MRLNSKYCGNHFDHILRVFPPWNLFNSGKVFARALPHGDSNDKSQQKFKYIVNENENTTYKWEINGKNKSTNQNVVLKAVKSKQPPSHNTKQGKEKDRTGYRDESKTIVLIPRALNNNQYYEQYTRGLSDNKWTNPAQWYGTQGTKYWIKLPCDSTDKNENWEAKT